MEDFNILFSSNKSEKSGVDGSVFSIIDNKYCLKVVTKSVDDFFSLSNFNSYFINLKKNIEYLIEHKSNPFVRVYDFKIIKNISNNVIMYCYTMDKCNDLSDDEWKVFHTIISHEDNNIIKDLSHDHVSTLLKELSLYLDFNYEHVIMFCNQLKSAKIKHLDLHPRNIMKDNFGNFKLVDLDRLKLEKNNERRL